MQMRNNNVSWLTSTPPNDMNFVLHLNYANENEIMEAISAVEKIGGKNKTKLSALNRELKKRQKAKEG